MTDGQEPVGRESVDATAISTPTQADGSDVVEVSLPAQGAYVSLLRTIAASLGARLDMTLDDIEDLRIAVNEATALLLARTAADSVLRCRFRVDGGRLTVRVAGAVGPETTPEQLLGKGSFAWTVLDALADTVHTATEDDGTLAVELTKRASIDAVTTDAQLDDSAAADSTVTDER